MISLALKKLRIFFHGIPSHAFSHSSIKEFWQTIKQIKDIIKCWSSWYIILLFNNYWRNFQNKKVLLSIRCVFLNKIYLYLIMWSRSPRQDYLLCFFLLCCNFASKAASKKRKEKMTYVRGTKTSMSLILQQFIFT